MRPNIGSINKIGEIGENPPWQETYIVNRTPVVNRWSVRLSRLPASELRRAIDSTTAFHRPLFELYAKTAYEDLDDRVAA